MTQRRARIILIVLGVVFFFAGGWIFVLAALFLAIGLGIMYGLAILMEKAGW